VLKDLGLTSLPGEGEYFVSLEDWAERNLPKPKPSSRQRQSGMEEAGADRPLTGDDLREQVDEAVVAPWDPKDRPELARWLADNNKALDALAAATRRTHYHLWQLGGADESLLLGTMQYSARRQSQGARALLCRAMGRVRAGQVQAAWQDILAVHRLARLMAQDPQLVPQVVSVGMEETAAEGGAALAATGRLTRQETQSMLSDLQSLAPLPPIVDVIDRAERFCMLDTMVMVSRGYTFSEIAEAVTKAQKGGIATPLDDGRRPRVPHLDLNQMLLVANDWWDRLICVLCQPTHAERERAYEAFLRDLREAKFQSRRPLAGARLALLKAGGWPCRKARSRHEATAVTTWMMPPIGRAVAQQVRAMMRTDLERLAMALAAWKAEKGDWPGKLEELSPAYMKGIPADRFTEEPMVYKPQPGGYVLYSKGINMTDDGGLDKRSGSARADDVAVWAGISPPKPEPEKTPHWYSQGGVGPASQAETADRELPAAATAPAESENGPLP
ncbi:MAG TPA: hypothetical protein VFJ30_11200, partial [Phycisphaerae bacterium]|nr:hypothetical protein [Phycisphaerae bacterium]